MTPPSSTREKSFALLTACYGDHPEFSVRMVKSVQESCFRERNFEFLIGANECSKTTLLALREAYRVGDVDMLLTCRKNLNKDPILRLLLSAARSEYVLWVDDDTTFIRGWDRAVSAFIEANKPFDSAGTILTMAGLTAYHRFLHARPWFEQERELDFVSRFPGGGCFLLRRAFALEHNFPDKAMRKKHDDVLLGDLIVQKSGRLLAFDPRVESRFVIGTNKRRGSGESDEDYQYINPITGEQLEVPPSFTPSTRLDGFQRQFDLVREGQLLYDAGNYRLALAVFRRAAKASPATKAFPPTARLYYRIARTLLALQTPNRARPFLHAALKISPTSKNVLTALGELEMQSENLDLAATYIERALSHYTDTRLKAHNQLVLRGELARKLFSSDRPEEAFSLYERAIAEADLTEARLLASAHAHFGSLLAKKGFHQKALQHYTLSLQLNPNNLDVRNNLGNVCLGLQLYDQAIEHFQAVLDADPKHKLALHNRKVAEQQKAKRLAGV